MTRHEFEVLKIGQKVSRTGLDGNFIRVTKLGEVVKVYNGNYQVLVQFAWEKTPRIVGYTQIEIIDESTSKDLMRMFGALFSKNYKCPKCGSVNNNEDSYQVKKEIYPKLFNERKGYNLDGNYHDWDELHCCKKCKTKYWFINGAY